MARYLCVCSVTDANVIMDCSKSRVPEIRAELRETDGPLWIRTPTFMATLKDDEEIFTTYPGLKLTQKPAKFARPPFCLFRRIAQPPDVVFLFVRVVCNVQVEMPRFAIPITRDEIENGTVEVIFEKGAQALGGGFIVVEVRTSERVVRFGTKLSEVIVIPKRVPELTLLIDAKDEEIPRIQKRMELVEEIVSTEEEYVEDLHQMMHFWRTGFTEKGLMNTQELDLFFKDIPGILCCHEQFLKALQQANKGYASEFGAVFAEYAILFKAALPYITSSHSMLKVLTQKKMVKTFAAAIDEMTAQNRGKDFLSYLVGPVQRLPKYGVYLKQLVMNTPGAHPDAQLLPLACERIAEVNASVDEASSVQKEKTILSRIQEKLRRQGETVDVLAPGRRIVAKANVVLIRGSRTTVPAMFYLCNDILFVYVDQGRAEMIVQCDVRMFHYINSGDYRSICIVKFAKEREKIVRKEFKIIFNSSEDHANIMNHIMAIQREHVEHLKRNEKGMIWSLDPLFESVTPICHHSSVSNGKSIVFFGGLTTDYRILSSSFATYGYTENALENAPISTMTVSGAKTPGRYKHTLTYMNRKLYIVGGIVNTGDQCYIVEFNLDKLMYINACKSATISRYSHTCTAYHDKLYVFGGKDKSGAFLNDVVVIEPLQNKVTTLSISGTKPPARCGHSAVLYHGKLYIFGGKGMKGLLNDLWAFDLEGYTWNQLAIDGTASSRRSHIAVLMGAHMLLIGGISNTFAPVRTMSINLDTLRLDYISDIGNFPMGLRCSSGAVMEDGHIILYGGLEWGSKTPMNCVFRLDLSSDWTGGDVMSRETEVLDSDLWESILNTSCCSTMMSHKSTWVPVKESTPTKAVPMRLGEGAVASLARSLQVFSPSSRAGRACLPPSRELEQSRSVSRFSDRHTKKRLALSSQDEMSDVLSIEKTSEDGGVIVAADTRTKMPSSDKSSVSEEGSTKLDIKKLLPRPRGRKSDLPSHLKRRSGRHRSSSSKSPRRRSYSGAQEISEALNSRGKEAPDPTPVNIFGSPIHAFEAHLKQSDATSGDDASEVTTDFQSDESWCDSGRRTPRDTSETAQLFFLNVDSETPSDHETESSERVVSHTNVSESEEPSTTYPPDGPNGESSVIEISPQQVPVNENVTKENETPEITEARDIKSDEESAPSISNAEEPQKVEVPGKVPDTEDADRILSDSQPTHVNDARETQGEADDSQLDDFKQDKDEALVADMGKEALSRDQGANDAAIDREQTPRETKEVEILVTNDLTERGSSVLPDGKDPEKPSLSNKDTVGLDKMEPNSAPGQAGQDTEVKQEEVSLAVPDSERQASKTSMGQEPQEKPAAEEESEVPKDITDMVSSPAVEQEPSPQLPSCIETKDGDSQIQKPAPGEYDSDAPKQSLLEVERQLSFETLGAVPLDLPPSSPEGTEQVQEQSERPIAHEPQQMEPQSVATSISRPVSLEICASAGDTPRTTDVAAVPETVADKGPVLPTPAVVPQRLTGEKEGSVEEPDLKCKPKLKVVGQQSSETPETATHVSCQIEGTQKAQVQSTEGNPKGPVVRKPAGEAEPRPQPPSNKGGQVKQVPPRQGADKQPVSGGQQTAGNRVQAVPQGVKGPPQGQSPSQSAKVDSGDVQSSRDSGKVAQTVKGQTAPPKVPQNAASVKSPTQGKPVQAIPARSTTATPSQTAKAPPVSGQGPEMSPRQTNPPVPGLAKEQAQGAPQKVKQAQPQTAPREPATKHAQPAPTPPSTTSKTTQGTAGAGPTRRLAQPAAQKSVPTSSVTGDSQPKPANKNTNQPKQQQQKNDAAPTTKPTESQPAGPASRPPSGQVKTATPTSTQRAPKQAPAGAAQPAHAPASQPSTCTSSSKTNAADKSESTVSPQATPKPVLSQVTSPAKTSGEPKLTGTSTVPANSRPQSATASQPKSPARTPTGQTPAQPAKPAQQTNPAPTRQAPPKPAQNPTSSRTAAPVQRTAQEPPVSNPQSSVKTPQRQTPGTENKSATPNPKTPGQQPTKQVTSTTAPAKGSSATPAPKSTGQKPAPAPAPKKPNQPSHPGPTASQPSDSQKTQTRNRAQTQAPKEDARKVPPPPK